MPGAPTDRATVSDSSPSHRLRLAPFFGQKRRPRDGGGVIKEQNGEVAVDERERLSPVQVRS